MNRFTKEELLILHLDLSTRIESAKILKVPAHVIALRDKIQTLIETYCSHADTYHCDYCGIVSCEGCLEPCGGELIDG